MARLAAASWLALDQWREAHDCRGNDRDNSRQVRTITLSRKKIDGEVRLRKCSRPELATAIDLTSVGAYSARLRLCRKIRDASRAVEDRVRFDNDKCLFP
jgi:hypothetical protein